MRTERALGVHRVLEPVGVLPQAARRLDADPAIGADEVRIAVQRLNLDAASFRQLVGVVRRATATPSARPCSASSPTRGKMQNPVTGSGGMLIGVVDAVGPDSPAGPGRGRPGGHPGLARRSPRCGSPTAWPGGTGAASRCRPRGRRCCSPARSRPCCPTTCPTPCPWRVLDVCGAPAATARVVERSGARSVTVLGAAGKSGCLSLAAARRAGADPADRAGARRRRGRGADRRRAGRPGRRRRRDRPAGRRRRGGGARRPHRRLRRRARRRARRGPRDGRRGHRGLLLHGDVVHRGGARCGGDGGGRDDAGRQRLHAGARGPGPGPLPVGARACGRWSTRGCTHEPAASPT